MKQHTEVRINKKIEQRDYTDEGQVERLKYVGRCGYTITSHDSHGICYEVQFSTGIATYDPDEFTIL